MKQTYIKPNTQIVVVECRDMQMTIPQSQLNPAPAPTHPTTEFNFGKTSVPRRLYM